MNLIFGRNADRRGHVRGILDEFGKTLFGLEEVVKLCLVAFFTDGHVLLEGNPGMGKTDLVKTLASLLGVPWGRIQFTPDLMPSDITGTIMPNYKDGNAREFKFQRGPIFTSLLLADEINRATPKTQAAMLEAMGEFSVTVLGEKHLLDEPFMVLATQNPIDHEGTYSLPEAQLDRFMFKIHMPGMSVETLGQILAKTKKRSNRTAGKIKESLEQTREKVEKARRLWLDINESARALEAMSLVEQHINNLVFASNGEESKLEGLNFQRRALSCELAKKTIRFGCGPRGAMNLLLGAKAWALLFNEGLASEAPRPTAHDLAAVVLPVLRHRLKLDFDWEENFRAFAAKLARSQRAASPLSAHDALLVQFCNLTAPEETKYNQSFEEALRERVGRAGTV